MKEHEKTIDHTTTVSFASDLNCMADDTSVRFDSFAIDCPESNIYIVDGNSSTDNIVDQI